MTHKATGSQSHQGSNEQKQHPSHKLMYHKPGTMGVVNHSELALVVLHEAFWKPQKHFALGMSIAKAWSHIVDSREELLCGQDFA